MHFTTLLTAAGTALFAMNGVQAAGDFANSCSSFWVQSDNFLYATCSDGRGGTATSSLNLNACIGNYGSQLVCRANGNYAVSCSRCVNHTGTFMGCLCSSGSGVIDLNMCVANRGGLLACA